MKFPLTEPTSPRYLYINPKTNAVHVLMPVVSGIHIGLDNTCKSVSSLQEFFGKSRAVHQRAIQDELSAYKKALEFDISLLAEESESKRQKQERLSQIKQYIAAIDTVLNTQVLDTLSLAFPEYPALLQAIMKEEDVNFHSMVLRPKEMDSFLRFVNPVFSVNRDGTGAFYNTLSKAYQGVTALLNAKPRFINGILELPEAQGNDVEALQRVLREKTLNQFKVDVDFYHMKNNAEVTKALMDEYLGSDEENPSTAQEYIGALLEICAGEIFNNLPDSPFYTRKNAEELSIITQFFLANINIYCYANQISTVNFGKILDDTKELSREVAGIVLCITEGDSIEDALLDFVNKNSLSFGLSRELAPADSGDIKRRFTQNYAQIKESPHFDEFALLDDNKPGPFIHHQGSICLNFAEFVKAGFPNLAPDYFESIRADFNTREKENITPTNSSVHASIELSVDELLANIKDEDQLEAVLKTLPEAQKNEILASPQIKRMQVPKFLLYVARGEQDKAEELLKANPDAQFLLQSDSFTDYSGRTFNCTAFEYAYWAKDTHMCRMLIQQMDDETKSDMLRRCEAMEENGLGYIQNEEVKNSKHFEFEPLIEALKDYVDGFDKRNWNERGVAWRKVGIPQRDLPVHVANEYCRPDRSFNPLPEFNEPSLPRVLTFYNWETEGDEAWFPLPLGENSGLGFDFVLYRAWAGAARGTAPGGWGGGPPWARRHVGFGGREPPG